jgi:hypothetical protein
MGGAGIHSMKDLGKAEHGTAAYWRDQAEQARASAADLQDGEAKATLENIARMFESMAKLAELGQGAPTPGLK